MAVTEQEFRERMAALEKAVLMVLRRVFPDGGEMVMAIECGEHGMILSTMKGDDLLDTLVDAVRQVTEQRMEAKRQ